MGYMTCYELYIDDETGAPLPTDELTREIEKMEVFDEVDVRFFCSAYTEWCDWQDDMRLLSARFPNLAFKLYGDGDDSGDFWVAYFRDGACQLEQGEIVYPEFDPEKLEKSDLKTHYSYERV